MNLFNDGSKIILSQERYLELLANEQKIKLLESARQTMKNFAFDNLIDAMFPAPKGDDDA